MAICTYIAIQNISHSEYMHARLRIILDFSSYTWKTDNNIWRPW